MASGDPIYTFIGSNPELDKLTVQDFTSANNNGTDAISTTGNASASADG